MATFGFDSVSKKVNSIGSSVPGSTGPLNIFSGFRDFFGANGDLSSFYSNFSDSTGLSSSAYKLTQNYYFRTSFNFTPNNSIVYNRLKTSLVSFSGEPLKFLVKRADLPNFNIQKGKNLPSTEYSEHEWGFINSPGFALGSDNKFDITFLSTERSLHEYIFYYWIREVAATFWTYKSQPYTTATVTFEFLDAKKNTPYMKYIYTGVYPVDIKLIDPNQQANQEYERIVKFEFSSFYISYSKSLLGNTPLGILYEDLV